MKVFDFNIHLPILNEDSVNSTISNEQELNVDGVIGALDYYKQDLEPLVGFNVMLFNQKLMLENESVSKLRSKVGKDNLLTLLFDFRSAQWQDKLQMAYENGIRAIKFHSYVQKIEETNFDLIVSIASRASELGMIICVDASYGTINMYRYDNLKLICAIAAKVIDTPIIILHSGGARTLEAMLIADERKNVWLETSFSLPYYLGSSIEEDLAFVYKKIGASRLLYGTDFPYVGIQESVDIHMGFFSKFKFSDTQIESIMSSNAQSLIDQWNG